jgi:hypothetical protein
MKKTSLFVLISAILAAAVSGCAATAVECYNEGLNLLAESDAPLAREKFLAALELRPKYPDALIQLGLAEYMMCRPADALESEKKACSMLESMGAKDDRYGEALHYRAQFASLVDRSKAVDYWKEYLEYLHKIPGLERESKKVEAVIQALEAGLPVGVTREEWEKLREPGIGVQEIFDIVRKSAADDSKFLDPRKYKEAFDLYEGAISAVFFTEKSGRIEIRGAGRSTGEALQNMLAKAPRSLARNASAPCAISIVSEKRAPAFIRDISADFQPGIDGIAAFKSGFKNTVFPEECVWGGFAGNPVETAAACLKMLMDQLPDADEEKVQLTRFRVKTYLQRNPGEEPVQLARCHSPARGVSADNLKSALVAAGEYLLRQQAEDGKYAYLFYPRKGYAAKEADSLIRQAGTAWSMAVLGKRVSRPDFIASARKAAEFFKKQLQKPDGKDFMYIIDPDSGATLGVAALAALLFNEAGAEGGGYSKEIEAIARFLLFMQNADGTFRSKYAYNEEEADIPVPQSEYYPQEAVYALATLGVTLKNAEYLKAAERGARALLAEKAASDSASSKRVDHWLVKAAAIIMESGVKDLDLRGLDAVMSQVEGLVRTAGPEDFRGTVDVEPIPRSAISGSLLEAYSALMRINKLRGRDTRKTRGFIQGLASFSLRCQITNEENYYMSGNAGLGGFMKSLVDDEIRADTVQHNILGLLGAVETLYGK